MSTLGNLLKEKRKSLDISISYVSKRFNMLEEDIIKIEEDKNIAMLKLLSYIEYLYSV